jgi:hypothetical protein
MTFSVMTIKAMEIWLKKIAKKVGIWNLMIRGRSCSVPPDCHAVSIFVGDAWPLESHGPISYLRSLSISFDSLLFLIRGRSGAR